MVLFYIFKVVRLVTWLPPLILVRMSLMPLTFPMQLWERRGIKRYAKSHGYRFLPPDSISSFGKVVWEEKGINVELRSNVACIELKWEPSERPERALGPRKKPHSKRSKPSKYSLGPELHLNLNRSQHFPPKGRASGKSLMRRFNWVFRCQEMRQEFLDAWKEASEIQRYLLHVYYRNPSIDELGVRHNRLHVKFRTGHPFAEYLSVRKVRHILPKLFKIVKLIQEFEKCDGLEGLVAE